MLQLGIKPYRPPSTWFLAATLCFIAAPILGLMVCTFIPFGHVLGASPAYGTNPPEYELHCYCALAPLNVIAAVLLAWFVAAVRMFVRLQVTAGFALCMGCGYDLVATNQHSVCPECGRKVDLAATEETVNRLARRFPRIISYRPPPK